MSFSVSPAFLSSDFFLIIFLLNPHQNSTPDFTINHNKEFTNLIISHCFFLYCKKEKGRAICLFLPTYRSMNRVNWRGESKSWSRCLRHALFVRETVKTIDFRMILLRVIPVTCRSFHLIVFITVKNLLWWEPTASEIFFSEIATSNVCIVRIMI